LNLLDISVQQASLICEFLRALHARLDGAQNSAEHDGCARSAASPVLLPRSKGSRWRCAPVC
jgi:hypothetical protein